MKLAFQLWLCCFLAPIYLRSYCLRQWRLKINIGSSHDNAENGFETKILVLVSKIAFIHDPSR